MTCISSRNTANNSIAVIKQYFNIIGEIILRYEVLIDSAKVSGACGIAYVLRFIKGKVQSVIKIVFDKQTATKIVT